MPTPRFNRPRARRPARVLAFVVVAVLCLLVPLASPAAGPARQTGVEFNRDIRPILSENCYSCHGPDKNRRKAKLRLDERAAAVASQAIVPGKPDDSEVIARILSDEADEVMPPPSSHKSLTPGQKDLLKQWISQGAEYQAHWAYVPPVRPAVPSVHQSAWVRNPIDAFILSRLESRGITPSPEAPKRTLIRRLSLDLIGLPPTPEEVRAFEEDSAPRAYESLVDRLLESPHYGERMAVPWLDMARFADTVGYHGDQGQRIFPYRDYVIDAFNQNKPFDVFTVEQLAGDLLPNATPEQLVATGFNRLNMMTREGGAQPGEYLAKYASDRVRTVAITWLGSTMGCAECHDHKYDPFTQRDFYSLAAFFADVKQWGVYQDYDYTPNPELKGWSNDHPFPPEIEVESPYLKRRREQLQGRISQICTAALTRAEDDPKGKSAFEGWINQAAAFARSHPTGWHTPSATAELGARVLPDGSVLLADPADKNAKAKGDQKNAWTFTLKPGAGRLARIRIELLPHVSHGGKITRDGFESASVSLRASVHGKGLAERPLSFFLAEAKLKDARYFNGDEIPGIRDGWRTSKLHSDKPHTGVWCMETPVDLTDDDEVKIIIETDRAGCVRLSVSPFGFDPGRRDELDSDQRSALARGPHRHPNAQRAELAMLYSLALGSRSPAWSQIQPLCQGILDCGDGKTYTMVTQPASPRVVRVLPRGNWQDESGPVVEPAIPHFLPRPGDAKQGARLSRLDLARWLTSAENPLTARVFMNRIWRQFFGTGISSQVEDVGAQGEWPVHPDLLDWLAVEFRECGWDVKKMIKRVVTSSAYRQDSRLRPELHDVDPGNRLVAYQSPRRLEAEFARDNALAISGLLNRDLGGPSVFPYQPPGYYSNLQFPDRDYIASDDDRQYRRGVYMHWQRTFLQPMLANFDASPREECTATRNVANTPQQALTLLNDPTFVEAARVLAQVIVAGGPGKTDSKRIDRLYQRALARAPSVRERDSLLVFLAAQRAFYQGHTAEAEALIHAGLAARMADCPVVELAAWTTVCRVVLDLHETITRY